MKKKLKVKLKIEKNDFGRKRKLIGKDTNYTVVLHKEDGTTEGVDEWFSLGVARKIAAKAYEARTTVVNSPVTAIEIVDFNGNQVQIVKFDS